MDWQLAQKQSLSLEEKIILTQRRIREMYERSDGMIYVAYSGGLDSEVMLDLVRDIYPDTPAVFCDTGLEYPEIREQVKSIDNVTWIRPRMNFKKVLETYGYPVFSKPISMGLERYRRTTDPAQKHLRLHGGICKSSGKKQGRSIPIKYHEMIHAPFLISDYCCTVMKKQPFAKYQRETGRFPLIGIRAEESNTRKMQYLKQGCIFIDNMGSFSKGYPMMVWRKVDILEYLLKKKKSFSKIYGEIIVNRATRSLELTGVSGTGCIFCMFGCDLERKCTGMNRFQKLYISHPDLWEYCMFQLGIYKILQYIKEPSKPLRNLGLNKKEK